MTSPSISSGRTRRAPGGLMHLPAIAVQSNAACTAPLAPPILSPFAWSRHRHRRATGFAHRWSLTTATASAHAKSLSRAAPTIGRWRQRLGPRARQPHGCAACCSARTKHRSVCAPWATSRAIWGSPWSAWRSSPVLPPARRCRVTATRTPAQHRTPATLRTGEGAPALRLRPGDPVGAGCVRQSIRLGQRCCLDPNRNLRFP